MPASRFQDFAFLSDAERQQELARCVERTAHLGRKLGAVVRLCDAPLRREGSLADWPYAAKDLFGDGVTAPTWGCAGSSVGVQPRAAVLQRMDAAGACCLAAAEMTELAYEPSGHNAARGRPLNPWNKDAVCGGSSSGSAVLVAAGCVPVALGSDTGGSVRIPAQCCGVTALKPSWGALPVDGVMPLAPSLDTVGIIARAASDIRQVWAVMADRPGNPTEIRSAAVLADAFATSDDEVAHIGQEAVLAIGDLGLSLMDCEGLPDEADRHALRVMQAEAARTHRRRLEDSRIEPTLRKRLGKGLSISDADLRASLDARAALREEFLGRTLGGCDIGLLPVMPVKTPWVAEVDPTEPAFQARTLYAMSRFTRFANYLGVPVLALPVGFDGRGLPIGLQVVGRPDSEASLIKLGEALQERHDWHGHIPTEIAPDIAAEKGSAS
jgi:Asp-tRNA(Asn)/Glu-tRNA(Gln) amidotransferase A subunit family amidase